MRSQFTFYESFFKAVGRIKKKADRADAYDMICAYALYRIEPDLDSASDAVAIAFELLRPVLDKAQERSESGKKGRSKPEANDKQTGNKPEANDKQTGNKPEANREQTGNKKKKEMTPWRRLGLESSFRSASWSGCGTSRNGTRGTSPRGCTPCSGKLTAAEKPTARMPCAS